MRYHSITNDDVVNGEGICTVLRMQGCDIHCDGCNNKELWNYDDGQEISIEELALKINDLIHKDGIVRNFSILGGEPLSPRNFYATLAIIDVIRELNPNIKIFLWTRYSIHTSPNFYLYLLDDFKKIDYIIDGKYDKTQRDTTLHLCSSKNQTIIDVKKCIKEMEKLDLKYAKEHEKGLMKLKPIKERK